MYFQQMNLSKSYSQRANYRNFSRQVLTRPTDIDLHTSRIMAALELPEKEPLQGALADMFYGCWYDVPFFGERILAQVEDKLNATTRQAFQDCIDKKTLLETLNPLSTRWSVLTQPSMAAVGHQLRASSDDSRALANYTTETLLDVWDDSNDYNDPEILEAEDDFFAHCLACDDRLAFSIVWWQLSKNGWVFSSRWTECRLQLEQ